jgi:ribulose-phosphate 3-epimerase
MLSANFANLQADIQMINESEADWFHLDIMDGLFVPNISFGFPLMQVFKELAKKPLDVHLMIDEPQRYFERFKDFGADILSIHYENATHLHRSIQEIKNLDMKASVVLNPHTSVDSLENVIQDLDMVLIMSVNPGYGGQKFIENTYTKISQLKELIIKKSSNSMIQVDGGVNIENAAKLFDAGANALVAGNAVFKSNNPKETIKKLKAD